MQQKEYTMLSLGDSYTIGEKADEADRFPNQTVMMLHSKGIYFEKPKIIAATGWTTDELASAIQKENLNGNYDFVTLLIGVNNQYRGKDVENYHKEFIELLEQSIQFADGKPNHVIVLSVPDWGVTKFAEGRDRNKIASEIDAYNAVNNEESEKRKVNYINITSFTRQHADWVMDDGLHPDSKQYELWANEVVKIILNILK
ncbi:MAG: GDSL-type esterase/lipase family protein [Chitinophagales bacterium]|nr:GDSL-type esterase/lipase family protein [Chitinophagales bacterium]